MKIKIDENKFRTIKDMLMDGMTMTSISKTVEVSYITVQRIKAADSLEGYRKANCDSVKKYSRSQTVKKSVTVKRYDAVSSFQASRQIELMEQLVEIGKSISNKLAFIVEQLS